MDKNNCNRVFHVSMEPPSLEDNTADAQRLINALKKELNDSEIDIEFSLLRKVPSLLRKYRYRVRCILVKERGRYLISGLQGADEEAVIAGLAVDLGTTRVAFRLIDLSDGRTMGELAFDNPQISIGADILTRIHYSATDGGLEEINRLIIDGFNTHIEKITERCHIRPENIHFMAVAGNTAMTHLFISLDPAWLIREPYIPVTNSPGMVRASDLGLKVDEGARVFIFPNTGSYFGGDLVAGILYSEMHKKNETALLVDVGTNAEVVLGNSDWLVACAGAAGPALEGGVSSIGMNAGPGVIDSVAANDETGELEITTIEDLKPIGICGSGFIDLASALFTSGMVDMRGRLVPQVCGERLFEDDGMRSVVIVPSAATQTGDAISISQASLDSLIRSKAAMYTILDTITMNVGITFADIEKFYVAGTFGSFINPRSAITIGMLPDLSLDKFDVLGNSSLGGASMIVKSNDCLDEIKKIRDRITYVELNVDQGFMNRFSGAKFLPHTDPGLFPSVKIP